MKHHLFPAVLQAAFACLLAVVGSSSLHAASYKEAEITRLQNDVKVLKENVTPKSAAVGQKIDPVTSVATGANSRAELRFPDKSLTRLGANSRFTLRGDARTLDLDSGVLMLQVPDQIKGAKVRTAAVTAAVTGGTVMFEFLPDGYVKVIVVEGYVDLSMNSDPSNFITINAGQMIIMKPNSTTFPLPVDVDLKRLLKTSQLLNANDNSTPNSDLVNDAVNSQQSQILDGQLVETNLVIPGRGTVVNLTTDSRLRLFDNFTLNNNPGPNGGNGGNGGPKFRNSNNGQPLVAQLDQIKGKTILNGYATIYTNPHVTAYNTNDHAVVTHEGKIYNGLVNGPFPAFAFGSPNIVSGEFQNRMNQRGDWAAFRFESLLINGNPDIVVPLETATDIGFTPVYTGVKNLALAADGDILLGRICLPDEGDEAQPTGRCLDLQCTDLDSLLLYTQAGNITIDRGFKVRGYNQNVEIVAAGIASDVNVSGSVALDSSSGTFITESPIPTATPDGTLLAITAGQDINIAGCYAILNADNINLDAGRDIVVDDKAQITAKKNIKMVAQGVITIGNSSQLKALCNLAPDGIIAMQAGKDINITGDGVNTTLEGREIQIESLLGNVTLSDVVTSGDIFKARTMANAGVLEITGDKSSINAATLIRLYAEGNAGTVLFSGNTSLNSSNIDIAGNTVQIAPGKVVTVPVSSNLNVYANQHKYNDSVNGIFSDGSYQKEPNRGNFNSRPAFHSNASVP